MESMNLRESRKDLRNLHKPVLDALFPKTRQDILATTLADPTRDWYLSDLARHLDVTPSSLQRELSALVGAGIVCRRADGNRVYYQANQDCPCFDELRGLLLKVIDSPIPTART